MDVRARFLHSIVWLLATARVIQSNHCRINPWSEMGCDLRQWRGADIITRWERTQMNFSSQEVHSAIKRPWDCCLSSHDHIADHSACGRNSSTRHNRHTREYCPWGDLASPGGQSTPRCWAAPSSNSICPLWIPLTALGKHALDWEPCLDETRRQSQWNGFTRFNMHLEAHDYMFPCQFLSKSCFS
jgi:hypothetical protein